MVDNEVTLKRFYREADHIRLEPANGRHATDHRRQGRGRPHPRVLVGVVRKCDR